MGAELQDPRENGVEGLKGLQGFAKRYGIDLGVLSRKELLKQLNMALAYLASPEEYVGTEEYGLSRYDTKGLFHKAAVRDISDLDDINSARGEVQPWVDLIGAGIAKGVVLAATTYADGVAGTIAGLINVAITAGTYKSDDEIKLEISNVLLDNSLTNEEKNAKIDKILALPKGVMDAFINNPFSQAMNEINKRVEDLLPNYMTKEEQEAPWYNNIFTANFIGNSFLKNLGFTIGAAYSAKTAFNLAAKATNMNKLRNAFKGAVTTASGRTLNTSAEIAKAYKTGDAFMDGIKLTEDLAKSAKSLKNLETGLKIGGAVTSAAGEGRIEAISNSKEWFDLHKSQLDDAHQRAIDSLENQMWQDNQDYFTYLFTPEGVMTRVMTDEGKKEWEKRKLNLDNKYNNTLGELASSRATMANTIFGLNVALLTASNLFQFGKFISGGYSTGRISKGLTKGNLQKRAGRLYGVLQADKSKAEGSLASAIATPFSESFEEMSLALISESSGLYQAAHINNFYGSKIDPEAEAQTISVLQAFKDGLQNTYGNTEKWEEGFVGFITGMMGIPSFSLTKNALGKVRPTVEMLGEMWEGIRDYRKLKKEAEEIASAINERIKDPKFIEYYQGLIRHNKYQNEMDNSLATGDIFGFKNGEHSLLISDAELFRKAGRLLDLHDLIEEAGTVTLEDVDDIRNITADKATGKSVFEEMTDLQVVEYMAKQKNDALSKLEKYEEISTNLKTLYGDNLDSETLSEMTWMLTSIDDWENRSKQLMEKIKEPLKKAAAEIKKTTGEDISVTLNNFVNFEGSLFTKDNNLLEEINKVIDDYNLGVEEKNARIAHLIKVFLGKKVGAKATYNKAIRRINDLFNSKEIESIIDTAELEQQANEKSSTFASNAYLQLAREIKLIKKAIAERKSNQYINDEVLKRLIDSLNLVELSEKQLAEKEGEINNIVTINKLKRVWEIKQHTLGLLEIPLLIRNESLETNLKEREESVGLAYDTWKERESVLLGRIEKAKEALKNNQSRPYLGEVDNISIIRDINDLIKLYVKRNYFINKYESIANNPGLFTQEMQQLIKDVKEQYAQKEVKANLEKFSKVKTLKEFKDLLSNTSEEIRESIFDKLKESDDENIKKIIKNYEEILELSDNIANISEDVTGVETDVQSIVNILKDAFDNAETAQDVKDSILEAINNIPLGTLTDTLKLILSTLEQNKKSAKSNKPAKKSKSDKRSLLDDEEDDELEKEEEESEDDEEDEEEDSTKDDEQKEDEDEALKESKKSKKKTKKVINPDNSLLVEKDATRLKIFVFDTPEGLQLILSSDKEKALKELEEEYNKDDIEDSDIVTYLKNADINVRKKLLNSINGKIDELDYQALEKLIEEINNNDINPSAGLDDIDKEEESNSDTTESALPRPLAFLRSWQVAKYNFKELKDREKRKAVLNTDSFVKALDSLGAYDFVDLGHLATILKLNPNTEIHYIISSRKEFNRNNGPVILLGVEITDEIKKKIGTENLTLIEGHDKKQYLIVGTLGFPGNNDSTITQKASGKAIANYNLTRDAVLEEWDYYEGNGYYVSTWTNKIKKIYSGRMVKSDESVDVSTRLLSKVLGLPEKPIIGIYYSLGNYKHPLLSEYEDVVPLNDNNNNPREGSVWLMTKEADGRWYSKTLQVRRFTADDWDIFDDAIEDTPIAKKIKECVTILADDTLSDYNRSLAKYELENLLYFPEGTEFVFTGNIISLKYDKEQFNNIGEDLQLDDKVDVILETLLKPELNLRLLVSGYLLSVDGDAYVKELLNSLILTTDLLYYLNVNASFELYLNDLNNKNADVIDDDNESLNHTGRRGKQRTLSKLTVTVNSFKYTIEEDGSIFDKDGEEIDDEDVKLEVLLMQQIVNKKITPEEGTNIYLGCYEDGTLFGIRKNGNVLTGNELEKALGKNKLAKTNRNKVLAAEDADDLLGLATSLEEAEKAFGDMDGFEAPDVAQIGEEEPNIVDTLINNIQFDNNELPKKPNKLNKRPLSISEDFDEVEESLDLLLNKDESEKIYTLHDALKLITNQPLSSDELDELKEELKDLGINDEVINRMMHNEDTKNQLLKTLRGCFVPY